MPVITNPYRHAVGPTFGNASRYFDGVNDDINMGDVLDQGTQSFTVCAWVKPVSVIGDRTILAKQKNSDPYLGVNFGLYNNGSILLSQTWGSPNSFTNVQSTTKLTDNVWTHVAGVLNGGNPNDWRLYINGASVSYDIAGTTLTGSSSDNSFDLLIGYRSLGGRFYGNIADVRFYLGAVLTPSQILDIYNGSHIASGISGWWLTDNDDVLDYSGNENHGTNNGSTYSIIGPKDLLLDLDAGNPASYSGTGTTWSDLSDHGNDGTLVNGVGYSSDGGGSLVFDGVDDYFNITSAIEEPANAISIWVNMQSTDPCPIVYYGDDSFSSFVWTWGIAVYPSGTHGFNERPLSYPTNDLYAENVELNVWKNFVLVRDDNGDAKVYKNGALVGTKLNGGTTSLRSTSDRLFIGKAGSTYGNFLLSKVSIYNRVLTSQEIQQNFELHRGRFGI